jgi:hypothetical protein
MQIISVALNLIIENYESDCVQTFTYIKAVLSDENTIFDEISHMDHLNQLVDGWCKVCLASPSPQTSPLFWRVTSNVRKIFSDVGFI